MTEYSFDDLEDWENMITSRLDAIVATAFQSMINGIEIGPSITRDGFRREGTIPFDLGMLAGSLQSELLGSTSISATGEESHIIVTSSMKAGDTVYFSWGGAAAPYAAEVHWGANGVEGTHWIDVAAGEFKGDLVDAIAKAQQAYK